MVWNIGVLQVEVYRQESPNELGFNFLFRGEMMRPLTDRGKSVLAFQINQERSRHSKFNGGKHLLTSTSGQEPRRIRFQNLSCRLNNG